MLIFRGDSNFRTYSEKLKMADLKLIDPRYDNEKFLVTEHSVRGNLGHFAGRFPQHIMTNNRRVDLGYTEFSYQILRRRAFPNEKIQREPSLRACIDIDEYLMEHGITMDSIDDAVSRFMSSPYSQNLQDYLPFFELVKPVYLYLIDEKKHELENVIG